MLQPGQPMVYGKDQDKGLKIDGFALKIVPAAEASTWDPTVDSAGPAFVMTQLDNDPAMPRPFGVFRSVRKPTLDELVHEQIDTVTTKRGPGALKDLLYTSDCWTVD
jgi:2-oxoglutarate ferredoxin oxidoreductase subunit beta